MCGYMVKNEDREEKWDMCVGEKKPRRRKKKENEDRKEKSGYAGGGENTKREKRKKKKNLLGWAKFISNHKDFDKF